MLKINQSWQFILALFFTTGATSFIAQNEANHWAFGNFGGISFDNSFPHAVSITTSELPTIHGEGVASISDASGNLLFYTDGMDIWNGDHDKVIDDLLKGTPSATQSAIIVPDPGNASEYYIFTVDNEAQEDGLQYVKYNSTMEMLTVSSIQLQESVTEKVTAIKKGDESGYWVLAHDWENNDFFIYEIDCAGLTLHSTQSVGASHHGVTSNTFGYMKFNSDGSRIAIANLYGNRAVGETSNTANSYGFVQVFNFNNLTGIIDPDPSQIVNIGLDVTGTVDDGSTLLAPYGLEFSNNSNYLYISGIYNGFGPGKIHQYDLTSHTITTIGSIEGNSGYDIGALQMGRDGRIYVAVHKSPFLGIINTPEIEILGTIDFTLAANRLDLPSPMLSTSGLPNFVQSIYTTANIEASGSLCNPTFSFSNTLVDGTYSWDFGDGSAPETDNTTPNHTYAAAGDYTVTLTVTNHLGCISVYTTAITAEECCPILDNVSGIIYHNIPYTISSNEYWSGTHYIEEGVVITVAPGATLDITNVDVILGECAGIDFQGNSTARINNSVFRPCNMERTWRGLYFFPSEGGEKPNVTINESTFKNAQTGVYFNGTGDTKSNLLDMTITNNLFLNNDLGIYLTSTNFNQHITGNTFNIEDAELFDNTNCTGFSATTNRYGILFWNVDATGKIAQNDFISTTNSNLLEFYGVDFGNSSAIITDNNFSNNHHAISAGFGASGKIENNQISISAGYTNYVSQIQVNNSNMVNIRGNQLRNTNNTSSLVTSGTSSAIKVANNSNNVWVKENEIIGFETGIHLDQSNNVTVAENNIENSWFYGVFMNAEGAQGSNTLVSCNTINMLNTPGADVTGIGYFQSGVIDYSIKIYSNCIFETNQAIHLENTSGAINNMPEIRNNYMYNYTRAGIENINMDGNIGTSGSDHSLSGRNSFIANNSPNQDGTTTGDIVSNITIDQNGNYGVGLFTTNVLGNSNAASFHSTSSCGGQNRWGNNYANEIDNIEICDAPTIALINLFINTGSGEILKPQVYAEINNLNTAILALSYLNEINPDAVEAAYNRIKTESDLIESDLDILTYNFYMLKGQYENAKTIAEHLGTETIPQENVNVIDFILNDITWNELSEEEQNTILTKNQVILAPSHIRDVETISSEELVLDIYPNPSDGNITIQFNVNFESPVVKIYDVNGKLIEVKNPASKNTLLELDVSYLAKGLYYIIIENDEITTQSKFVKY